MCATDLASLAGLDHAKRAVERALASSSGVHAVLFYGPEGAGKSQLARLLAKSWLCPTPLETGLACGECAVCNAFDADRAVDSQWVPPWGPSSFIKLSAMHPVPEWEKDRDRPPIEFVLDFFRTRPLMARAKVVVFERADRFTRDAANAFLKTLEDPPPYARVVLTTAEFTRVLPTVRSRCMCVACGLPDDLDGLTPAEAAFGGSPGVLAHVREHAEIFERLYDLLERTKGAPLGAAFKLAEELREVADGYARQADVNARAAHVRMIESVAEWLRREAPDRPDLLQAAAEAHRRVQGNAQAPIVYETLLMDLLYHG